MYHLVLLPFQLFLARNLKIVYIRKFIIYIWERSIFVFRVSTQWFCVPPPWFCMLLKMEGRRGGAAKRSICAILFCCCKLCQMRVDLSTLPFPNLINHFEHDIVISWPKPYLKNNAIHSSPKARLSSFRFNDTDNPKLIIGTSGNRFCLNVNRKHKRNNIFFEINFHNFSWQRCHDELFVEYKSPEIGLSLELFFSIRDKGSENSWVLTYVCDVFLFI